MFGIPLVVWQWVVIPILKYFGMQAIASLLSSKLIQKTIRTLEQLKTYHDNSDFPDPYPGQTNQSNFGVSQR
jgi:hypothetical protein